MSELPDPRIDVVPVVKHDGLGGKPGGKGIKFAGTSIFGGQRDGKVEGSGRTGAPFAPLADRVRILAGTISLDEMLF